MVGQDAQVLVGHVVVAHERWQEMNHRSRSGILEDGNGFATLLEFGPGSGVGHVRRLHDIDGIIDGRSGLTAHAHAFHRRVAAHIGEQLDEVGIVDHGVVEQHLLLCCCQLRIVPYTPVVV